MKELTEEIAIDMKLTPAQCVRYYKPDWSDQECDYFVWNQTCFPFSNETFLKQLYNYLNKMEKNETPEDHTESIL